MRGECLLLLASAIVVSAALLLAAALRRRAGQGEPVWAAVKQVEVDDSEPEASPAVTVTYVFPWEGRMLERRLGPRRGVLPPSAGQRRELLYDGDRDCLREMGERTAIRPLLCYSAALAILAAAGGAARSLGGSLGTSLPVIAAAGGGVLFFAVLLPAKQRRRFRALRDDGVLQPVTAVFQGCERRADSEGESYLQPVYLCPWGGRAYRLEIGRGRRPYQTGETVILYRDSRTGRVSEAPQRAGRPGRP